MDSAPDLIEPVIGYRRWRLLYAPDQEETGGYLWSSGAGHTKWQPGGARAWCVRAAALRTGSTRALDPDDHHKAPAHGCNCGLYARHLASNFGPQEHPLVVGGQVILSDRVGRGDRYFGLADICGAIMAWGDLEVYHHGFRAEFAKVVALATSPSTLTFHPNPESWLRATARRYGVVAVHVDDLESAALRHGKPVPRELRPKAPSAQDHGYTISIGVPAHTMAAALTAIAKLLEDVGRDYARVGRALRTAGRTHARKTGGRRRK